MTGALQLYIMPFRSAWWLIRPTFYMLDLVLNCSQHSDTDRALQLAASPAFIYLVLNEVTWSEG